MKPIDQIARETAGGIAKSTGGSSMEPLIASTLRSRDAEWREAVERVAKEAGELFGVAAVPDLIRTRLLKGAK